MSYKSKQKMKAINKLALWTVLYLVLLIITLKLVSQTYYYDPGWAMFVLFIFLGLPLLIVGVVIMAIVLTRKIKNRYKVLIGFVIAIVMILIPSMFISHDIGLPNDSWEYNEELSKVYTLSRGGNFNGTLKYRVYVDMGENDNQDRRKARVYNN
ncbi:MAG TPA: hypothetical protein ENI49_04655, partial [Thermoplasmatales archaeon]|nr:hypothetical protein [Thermoplasmatales archaeon]